MSFQAILDLADVISALRERLRDQDAQIEMLQERVHNLEHALEANSSSMGKEEQIGRNGEDGTNDGDGGDRRAWRSSHDSGGRQPSKA